MKKRVAAILCLAVICLSLLTGCESGSRSMKSFKSNVGGGLQRTVTVYDYNGNEIKSWSGKFDVDNEGERTIFDLNGKRTIIRGGIIINEEQ